MRFIPKRKMSWTIIVFSVLMLVWLISAGGGSANCDKQQQFEGACKAGEAVGRGIATTAIFVIWFIGFVVLSIIWFMTRPKHRTCPVCGEDVKKGLTACKKCGHDFAAAAQNVEAATS